MARSWGWVVVVVVIVVVGRQLRGSTRRLAGFGCWVAGCGLPSCGLGSKGGDRQPQLYFPHRNVADGLRCTVDAVFAEETVNVQQVGRCVICGLESTELICDVCRRGWHSFVSTPRDSRQDGCVGDVAPRPIRQAVATANTATESSWFVAVQRGTAAPQSDHPPEVY